MIVRISMLDKLVKHSLRSFNVKRMFTKKSFILQGTNPNIKYQTPLSNRFFSNKKS